MEPGARSFGEHIRLRVDGPTAWVRLDRPERLNAFVGTMRADLHEALGTAGEAPGVRVVVITGAGRAFSAGADVETMEALAAANDEAGFRALVEAGMRVVERIRALPQLVVAAVNGVAVGAGASLAIACDFRIAAADARIGFTFNRIGLHPDWGLTHTLPRLLPPARAAALVHSGRILDAAEAEALGLFDRVVNGASLEEETAAWAAELAAKPPLAVAAAKRSFSLAGASDLASMLAVEAEAQLACFRSADLREGLAALREKRPPRFRGE